MQGVGQPRLGGAGAGGHLLAGQHPVGPLGDIGPGSDCGDPALQGVDIAIGPIQLGDRLGHVVAGDLPILEVGPEPRHEPGVGLGPVLTEIGQAAGIPQPCDALGTPGIGQDRGIVGQALQYGQVDRFGRDPQLGAARQPFQIGNQAADRTAIRLRLAPEQLGQRGKAMLLDRIDLLGREFGVMTSSPGQGAKGPIGLVPPGATGDLRHFRWHQPPLPHPVEFGQPGKGDMLDIKVEAHPDRIGRDQIVDFA